MVRRLTASANGRRPIRKLLAAERDESFCQHMVNSFLSLNLYKLTEFFCFEGLLRMMKKSIQIRSLLILVVT